MAAVAPCRSEVSDSEKEALGDKELPMTAEDSGKPKLVLAIILYGPTSERYQSHQVPVKDDAFTKKEGKLSLRISARIQGCKSIQMVENCGG